MNHRWHRGTLPISVDSRCTIHGQRFPLAQLFATLGGTAASALVGVAVAFLLAVMPTAAQAQLFASCTFLPPRPDGWTDCGFFEQKNEVPPPTVRATIVTNGDGTYPGATWVARDGNSVVRLHTQSGDINVAGSGLGERNDLTLEGSGGTTGCPAIGCEGQEQWWAHSILFPSDYRAPDPGGWGVAMDFHNTASGCTGSINCQANFHVIAGPDGLHFRGYGGLVGGPTATEYFADIGPVAKDTWYDFVYQVRWSQGGDGFFDGWVNGVKKLAYRGPTLYPGQGVYLKLANYHSQLCSPSPSPCVGMGAASSVIHDRVIRNTTADGVRDLSTPLSTPSQGAYEQNVATYAGAPGAWSMFGAETGTFSGGTIFASNVANSTVRFSFTGTAISWFGPKCNQCGIANVSIDGGLPTVVNTASLAASGSLTSEVLFSASGLAPGEHTIVITVTGTHTSPSTNEYIAVDRLDVPM